jgi:lipocalin
MIRLFAAILGCTATYAQTVQNVSTELYLGRWYQAFSDFAVEATFENASYCVTADYGLYSNKTISVENRERVGSTDGSVRRILGWANTDSETQPGQLTVHLQTTTFPAPYWIYELGPATYNGSLYEYSVVSDPFKLTLFVLARNLTSFAEQWQQGVLERLEQLGFTNFFNKPLPAVQENCTYW